MKNVFLTFILLVVFLAPAGNAFGQPAATVTFSNPNEALAYNELARACEQTKEIANYMTKQYRSGTNKKTI